MDLLTNTITKLWHGMQNSTVPIINISFADFFIALLIVSTVICTINIITGKHEANNGKD